MPLNAHAPEVAPVVVYGQTPRIALVHFRHGTGQRIVAFDQFHLEGVEVRSPHLLDPPKNLLVSPMDIRIIDSLGRDVEEPLVAVSRFEPKC